LRLLETLLEDLPAGEIRDVRMGLRWTAVVVEVTGDLRCGLCSSQVHPETVHGEPLNPFAGALDRMPAGEVARFALEPNQPSLASLGVAALNALLPEPPHSMSADVNAEQRLREHGAGKQVAVVGHFPFVPRLREAVGQLFVLELNPREGDLPAAQAPEILPDCEVIAITGLALANHTLESLLALCPPEAQVMVLGPSTPLSPRLFDFGVRWISGSVVEDVERVLKTVSQGGNFRQIHRAGVRLVTLDRERWQGRAA